MLDSTKYLNIYLDGLEKDLSPATIKSKVKIIRQLLEYLEIHDFENLLSVKKQDIYVFVSNKSWSSQTRSNAQFTIRSFFNAMKVHELSSFNGNELYPIIFTNKRDRILSYYSTDEIKAIIDSVNTTLKCGVRDKCMITIAAHTGLRAGDIVFLRFDEIKWDKNTIQTIQQKTRIPVEVTMTDEIKFLLIDYLKNHRKSDDKEYIFINSVTGLPFKDASILTSIVRKAFIRAGVDIHNKKAGAHSLRHSLATNLLKNNTPLPVITGVLGHTTVSTTEKYISIDTEGLRNVSLEVPNYE